MAAGRHQNLEGRHATLHMDDTSVVTSGPTVHEGEQRGESGNIGPLRRRGRPVRGPQPRDIRCLLRHQPPQEPDATATTTVLLRASDHAVVTPLGWLDVTLL